MMRKRNGIASDEASPICEGASKTQHDPSSEALSPYLPKPSSLATQASL